MIPEVRMRVGIVRSRGTVAAAVVVCCSSFFALASSCRAAAFTDPAVFAAAAAAAGIPINTDNFSTYPLGDISNGQTLGKFSYSFDPNPSDPTGTQPTIGLDGPNQVLTGAPFGAFVGGNSATLTFTGGTLLAFGATFTYAPADEPLLAGLYDLGILDGTGATTIGNPAGLSADGGSFFLGFIASSSAEEFSQISLFSLVDPPNGTTGSPFLIPAYEVNELVFGVPAPLIGHRLPAALAVGGVLLLGAKLSKRSQKRGSPKDAIC